MTSAWDAVRGDAAAGAGLRARVLAFARVLRAAGIGATTARTLDALRALPHVCLERRDDFRLALRANLVGSREEERRFDALFDAFWGGGPPPRPEPRRAPPAGADAAPAPGRPERRGDPRSHSREARRRAPDLASHWPGRSDDVEEAVAALARRLATRPGRRVRRAPRGPRLDLRTSLRRNLRHGGELLRLARLRRRPRRTRILLACDVSGSMDAHDALLLQLLFALQARLPGSRTWVFSTEATEITRLLRRGSPEQTLARVGAAVRHWSGGTRIATALRALNRAARAGGLARDTVVLIVSDGFDHGDPEAVAREMRALRRRARRVVWVNPLLATEGYAPLAAGMRAALPHVDWFLPAHDPASLLRLCRRLAAA